MSRFTLATRTLSLVVLLPILTVSAQVPDSISFQGHLTDPGGTVIDTTVAMTFKLYKGTVEVWTNTNPAVVVDSGGFNVVLGGNGLDNVAFNEPMKLGITVGGDAEISPRTSLLSSAYALGMRGMYTVHVTDGTTEAVNIIAGSHYNHVAPAVLGATISGGGGLAASTLIADSVLASWGTIGGGHSNTAAGWASTVAGGNENKARSSYSSVVGGDENRSLGDYSTVGGGRSNVAGSNLSTVAGGGYNTALGGASTVSGGASNSAGGPAATVPGGIGNRADGNSSFAAGYKAKAEHEGTFVWNDRSVTADDDSVVSTGVNQFLIRAAGGVGIGTPSPTSQLTVHGNVELDSVGAALIFPDGSLQTTAGGSDATWNLVGNSGTTPGTNFVGTTDSTALEIKVNNARALRIDPASNGTDNAPNLIGGASNNYAGPAAVGATIGGGGGWTFANSRADSVLGIWSTVGGGAQNTAEGPFSTIGGGVANRASGNTATVGGGGLSVASGDYSTIGGGRENLTTRSNSTVGGGYLNEASGQSSVVPGGWDNKAGGDYSLAAGRRARALNHGSFVWADNSVDANFASTAQNQFLVRAAGGVGIGTTSPSSQLTVHGNLELDSTGAALIFPDGSSQTTAGGSGSNWSLTGNSGTTPGTHFLGTTDSTALEIWVNNQQALRIEPAYESLYGYVPNVIFGRSSFGVEAGNVGATISGGKNNKVQAHFGTVGGGRSNRTRGEWSTVSGGDANEADGPSSAISGGSWNNAYGDYSSVGGGNENSASGHSSVVGGGVHNLASGHSSTVPGGSANEARGGSSFAAGRKAKAAHNGTFVWNDTSILSGTFSNDSLVSTAPNQFLARAAGGFFFYTDSLTTGATLAGGSGSWASMSDVAAKTDFGEATPADVLERLIDVPIQTWRYKGQDESITHMGPTAQDFYEAFGLGIDDKHIVTVDADGVAFAAIQGLYELVKEQQTQLQRQDEEIDRLRAAMARAGFE